MARRDALESPHSLRKLGHESVLLSVVDALADCWSTARDRREPPGPGSVRTKQRRLAAPGGSASSKCGGGDPSSGSRGGRLLATPVGSASRIKPSARRRNRNGGLTSGHNRLRCGAAPFARRLLMRQKLLELSERGLSGRVQVVGNCSASEQPAVANTDVIEPWQDACSARPRRHWERRPERAQRSPRHRSWEPSRTSLIRGRRTRGVRLRPPALVLTPGKRVSSSPTTKNLWEICAARNPNRTRLSHRDDEALRGLHYHRK